MKKKRATTKKPSESYDTVIIGAGMSGLAVGIRLAMYDQKVCILEKHSISGGLNSYYQRGQYKFDVGLHAMTNFVEKKERGRPLLKLLKGLRIPYEALQLSEQSQSKILFPDASLCFNNDLQLLRSEIAREFPAEIDSFEKLVKIIVEFDELNLQGTYCSAKEKVATIIKNQQLLEMIFCPLLIYGSAWENDMDFAQFVIMFKSIFLEGFSRPAGGVRRIIDLLMARFKDLGGEIYFRTGVENIIYNKERKVQGVATKECFIKTSRVFSSAGLPETYQILQGPLKNKSWEKIPRVGKLSFTESIFLYDKRPRDCGIDETIIFYNNRPKYLYQRPDQLFDRESAVICFPNNFKVDDYREGVIRFTHIANFKRWQELDRVAYKQAKEELELSVEKNILKIFPQFHHSPIYKDSFTPKTIKKFTSHMEGAVYGSRDKNRDGTTPIGGLYICGTDQGFLGIVGSILSGISMANLHGLIN